VARIGDFRLSVRHLFLVVPIAGLAWAVTSPFRDNSFLWHVRAGTVQLDRESVLTTDPFSLEFAGEPWRTQSWLADILFGALERAVGGIGWVPYYMFILSALTIVMVLVVTHHGTRHLGVTALAGFVLTWQAIPFANARPVIFSYLLLAAVAAALRHDRTHWAIAPIIWLWAMLHGSFVLGIGLVILEGLRRRSRRHFELAGIAVILATLTAHGIGIWSILLRFLSNRDALELIQEWRPPDYSNPFMVPFVVLVMAALYAATRGRLERDDLIVLIPFLLFGMLAVRNLYPAMIVALPYIAAGFVPEEPEHRRKEAPLMVAAIGLVIVLGAVIGLTRPVEFGESQFPAPAALEVIDEGPLFHGIGAGGYLIYAQWPERSVLVDDRAELYGHDGFQRYLDVADAKGWEMEFSDLGITQALLDPEWPLVEALATAGWEELYRDDNFVVARAP